MAQARYLYSVLASTVEAVQNCIKAHNEEWLGRHEQTIESLVKQYMPSGAGFDSGTTLDIDASHADKLVFHTSYHHMNDGGYYDGWTEHTVTVIPSLAHRFHLRISGRNRNDIKEYIAETFGIALQEQIEA